MRVAVIIGSMSDLPKIEPGIKILKEFGVNRLSIGIESFNEDKLAFMERKHNKENVPVAKMLRKNLF